MVIVIWAGNSESQYKKRICRVWKIQKNVPTQKMKKIISIVGRRLEVEKKETVVAWHGKILSQEKIDRAKKRYGTVAGNNNCNPCDSIARLGSFELFSV
jgi:hypothetical protein